MNRQIKFRAWDNEKKIWLDKADFCIYKSGAQEVEIGGTEYLHNGSSYNPLKFVENDLGGLYYNRNLIIQQYTGLNDSEGNEIYEGDIVINTTSDEEYCSPAVIVWGKYEFVGFSLAYKCNKLEDYHAPLIHKINGVDLVEEFSLSKMGTYQIVGNASENPELLN